MQWRMQAPTLSKHDAGPHRAPHTPQPPASVLLQDIAVVPFLVLLPLVESNAFGGGSPVSLLKALGPTAVTTVGSLGLLLVCGRIFLRRIFELVAAARSDETFVALCLLTVTGASLITQVGRRCVTTWLAASRTPLRCHWGPGSGRCQLVFSGSLRLCWGSGRKCGP